MDSKKFKMDNLKKLREEKHITQVKLSTELEISQEVISHYEIGNSKPNIDNLIKLADYLNCSTDYLLGRTETPTPVQNLNKKDLELENILNSYNSLSNERKNSLKDYLEFLSSKES